MRWLIDTLGALWVAGSLVARCGLRTRSGYLRWRSETAFGRRGTVSARTRRNATWAWARWAWRMRAAARRRRH